MLLWARRFFPGKASGVFFHEIFGHRIEGHRQKDESDRTDVHQEGRRPRCCRTSCPSFSIPTPESSDGTDLNGWYVYDDEGVKARPVKVVETAC